MIRGKAKAGRARRTTIRAIASSTEGEEGSRRSAPGFGATSTTTRKRKAARMSLRRASSVQKASASAAAARTLVRYELVLVTMVSTVLARASTPEARERGSTLLVVEVGQPGETPDLKTQISRNQYGC